MTTHSVVPCESARQLLGVYALGLATPEEQQLVDRHCATCEACGRTRDELIAVVPMLSLVDESEATAGLPEPRPELLRRIIAETRSDSSSGESTPAASVIDLDRHRVRRLVLRGSAAVGLVAAALVVVLVAPWASAPPTTTDHTTVTASAVSPRTGVHGHFVITSTTTGSQVSMSISGVDPGRHCRLVARGAEGDREVAASWVVSYTGTATIVGHTSMSATDVTGLRVVARNGDTLLTVPSSQLVAS